MTLKRSNGRLRPRGATLIEVMATMAVLLIAVAGITLMVLGATRQNRRNLGAAQASMVAERYLEQIVARGCDDMAGNPCSNVKALDRSTFTVCWTAGGEALEIPVADACPGGARDYRVAVDVDGHGTTPGGAALWEGAERGDPQIPAASNVLNVRVTVSWENDPPQVVALQTRIAP